MEKARAFRSWLVLLQITVSVIMISIAMADEAPRPSESAAIECEALLSGAKELPLQKLVLHLAATRDIHKLVAELEKSYGSSDFVVRIPFSKKRIFFLQSPELVRMVLKAKTSLGFVNRNFDLSHRHPRTINAVNTTDALWQDLHHELTDIFNTNSIAPLMEKYQGILLDRPEYNLNEALEEYFLRVWSEYTYGQIDVAEYQRVRLQWIKVLRNVFHSNRLNRLPVVGELTSRVQYMRYKDELDSVDQATSAFLAASIKQKQGAFYQLYERLRGKYGDDEAFLIARDNSLLGILVFDFIYGVTLDYVAMNAKTQDPNWKSRLAKSETAAFLYPWRFRVAEEPFGGAEAGDFLVINLVRGKAPFSAGPRVCSGAKLFGEVVRKLTEIYAGSGIQFKNPDEEIAYGANKDIPLMISKHQVKLNPKPEESASRCPFHSLPFPW